jgi:hypothetical protein
MVWTPEGLSHPSPPPRFCCCMSFILCFMWVCMMRVWVTEYEARYNPRKSACDGCEPVGHVRCFCSFSLLICASPPPHFLGTYPATATSTPSLPFPPVMRCMCESCVLIAMAWLLRAIRCGPLMMWSQPHVCGVER